MASLNYGNPVNLTAPLNRGLIHWWRALPQKYGGIYQYSLYGGRHGQFSNVGYGLPYWSGIAPPGGYGSIAYTRSGSHIVTMGAVALPSEWTWSCWIRVLSSAEPQRAVAWGGSGPTLWIYNGKFGLVTGASVECDPERPRTLLQWHHVLVTRGASEAARIYVDGIAGTGSATRQSMSSGTLTIGGSPDSYGEYTSAMIDDLRLYNRAMTAGEAHQAYWAAMGGYQNEHNWLPRFSIAQPPGGDGAGSIAAVATLAGSGTSGYTGTGSGAFAALLDGTGNAGYSGTGSVTAVAELSGSGFVTPVITGSGDVIAAAALAGSGVVANPVTGSGDVSFAVAAMSSSGVVANPVTGSGDVTFAVAAMAGNGLTPLPITGSGSVALAAALAGSGGMFYSGSGNVSAAPAKLLGYGHWAEPDTARRFKWYSHRTA